MKNQIFILLLAFCIPVFSQSIQLHYDFRHSIDPDFNTKNYPTIFFEYFNSKDYGSFLAKIQSDFIGEKNNVGKFFIQVSQSLRFWKPKVFVNIEYSGGLGIVEPEKYGYYISNAFSLGAAYQFNWDITLLNITANYTYNALNLPSHDFLGSLYWWTGFWNYKFEFSGDVQVWTQNKNRGDDYTKDLSGKRFSFFGEPQLWFNLNNSFSIGTKTNIYYHVLTNEDIFQIYPTLAVKYKLK